MQCDLDRIARVVAIDDRRATGLRIAIGRIHRVLLRLYLVAVSDQQMSAAEAIGARMGASGPDILASPHAFIGSVDTICDTIMERRERLGMSYITVGQRYIDEFAPIVARLSGK